MVYAIVRNNNSDKLELINQPIYLNRKPTEKELGSFHNYAVSLSCAYCNCIKPVENKKLLKRDLESRFEAIAWEDTLNELKKKYSVVAYSHRNGGWTGQKWQFDKDITFLINSNFGYGCNSYFFQTFLYKGLTLASYTDYVKYRYVDYYQITHHTHSYALREEEWEKVMKNALDFYNALVQDKLYVFKWLTTHLENLTNGIEQFRTASKIAFANRYNDQPDLVTGEDLMVVKADKIANSLDFIKNIKSLPIEVNPSYYIDRIVNVTRNYLPELWNLVKIDKLERDKLENELNVLKSDSDYVLYCKLYEKFYSQKYGYNYDSEMVKFLFYLRRRTLPDVPWAKIKNRIAALKSRINEVEKREKRLNVVKSRLEHLTKYSDKIQTYLKTERLVA